MFTISSISDSYICIDVFRSLSTKMKYYKKIAFQWKILVISLDHNEILTIYVLVE